MKNEDEQLGSTAWLATIARTLGASAVTARKELAMEIPITKIAEGEMKPVPTDDSKLGFGQHFTDHMFLVDYDLEQGWHDPRIEPYHDLTLSPAAMVLHYAQEVFEGLKAYHGRDGKVRLFRHRENLTRLNRSNQRMMIPDIDEGLWSEAIQQLVLLDRAWLPKTEGCSLYIRPTVIATDPFLGVRPSNRYLGYVIVGPVGAYYPEGFNPVPIWVSDEYVRAVRGGVGDAKTGGNYAASLKAQMAAKEAGYSQVLWLDAMERKYVEEVGTMNIFFRIDGTVITSPLTGSILPGVTRDSVLRLLEHWGVPVEQRRLSIDEVFEAGKKGILQEVFGSGTAAIITPVKEIAYRDERLPVGDGTTGELAQRLYDFILGIQYGYGEDPFGWGEVIG
jgi:branched-chain amino acid aminotransferase